VKPLSATYLGTRFQVLGSGTVLKTPISGFNGISDFDKARGAMTEGATMKVGHDTLRGIVIKDFYLQKNDPWTRMQICSASDSVSCEKHDRPVIVDWGLQSLAKNNYTQAKYFQWSRSTKSDGQTAETHMKKKRIYNAVSNGYCTIEIHTDGFNDFDGFDQTGYLSVHADDK
jgi:hypothetical protein